MLDCVRPSAAVVMKRKTASATLPVLRTRTLLVLSAGRLTLEASPNRSQVSEDRRRWIMLQKKSSWSTWSFPRSTGRSRLPVRTTQTLSVYSSYSYMDLRTLWIQFQFSSNSFSLHWCQTFCRSAWNMIQRMICTSQLLKTWHTSDATLPKKARVFRPSGFSHYFRIRLQSLFTLFFLPCFSLHYLPFPMDNDFTSPNPHSIAVSLPAGKAFRFLKQLDPLLILQENCWVFSTCALFDGYSCQEKTLGSR